MAAWIFLAAFVFLVVAQGWNAIEIQRLLRRQAQSLRALRMLSECWGQPSEAVRDAFKKVWE